MYGERVQKRSHFFGVIAQLGERCVRNVQTSSGRLEGTLSTRCARRCPDEVVGRIIWDSVSYFKKSVLSVYMGS